MPSARVALGAVGLVTVVATDKRNAKKRITALTIDAGAAAGNRRVQIQDRFIQSPTNAVPTPPAFTLASRFDAGLIANAVGNVRTFSANDLKNVTVLGQLELLMDVADGGFIASIAWEHE